MQHYEIINQNIITAFEELKKRRPGLGKRRLNFSWSNWEFGMEPLETSVKRLADNGIHFIELHGNHYGEGQGYKAEEVNRLLSDYDMKVSGICGMFSKENDLSSISPVSRQAAIDYIRREADFAAQVGATYMLLCPGAVGRPQKYDDREICRSIDTLRRVADELKKRNIRGAIEPIRSAGTSIVHTIAQAKDYIAALDHPGVQHINGDVYHMLSEESHIPQALIDAGSMLTNLHMADSNRRALGDGCLDVDNIIRALYLIGYDNESCFVTPEPLGPGSDPYSTRTAIIPSEMSDKLVSTTVEYFREREEAVLNG